MLQLDAHLNSHFNRNNAIELNTKMNQIMDCDYETTLIPGKSG
jgi:hypothetical protein